MNKSEELVYNKLLKEYKPEEIIKNCEKRKSPDFVILNENRQIEVKTSNNRFIIFTEEQKDLPDGCEIHIVRNSKVEIYRLGALKNNPNFKVVFQTDCKTVTISECLWNRLWDLKRSLKKRSIDEVITEILNRDKQGVK